MLVIFFALYIGIAVFLHSNKSIKYSIGLLPLLLFSILANVALAQNYTQSLIVGANDGIGVSNILASFFIPEDKWSQELFHSFYEASTIITIVLLQLYLLCLLLEGFKRRVH
ncbi:NADH-ubiquinone oxidoreductase chain 6 [Sporosarcina sp. ANT_H38]